TDTPDTPDTLYSIIFLRAFFTNTTNSLHIMHRINPSDTPHNTGSLDSFDNAHSPHNKQNRTDLGSDPVSEESASSRAKKTGRKKRSQGEYRKSASISEPNITQNQLMPGTKKAIISSTESSEDVLELFKRTNNDIEKIRASGRVLISK
ncbi:19869_t:CDS:2, partial [Gigaspora margarita]